MRRIVTVDIQIFPYVLDHLLTLFHERHFQVAAVQAPDKPPNAQCLDNAQFSLSVIGLRFRRPCILSRSPQFARKAVHPTFPWFGRHGFVREAVRAPNVRKVESYLVGNANLSDPALGDLCASRPP
eukprot:1000778-Amorphochlora_amoeboformis.AAC.3